MALPHHTTPMTPDAYLDFELVPPSTGCTLPLHDIYEDVDWATDDTNIDDEESLD